MSFFHLFFIHVYEVRRASSELWTLNFIENAIRLSALGKKNFLFIGHPDAGQRSAIIYSIVVSCQRHGVNPFDYLQDVLSRLPRMTNQVDIGILTPSKWSLPTT